ncbi:MAG: hypothetical protein GY765_25390, partial [bacterium]|nr:hypothetical protein [bacterium]
QKKNTLIKSINQKELEASAYRFPFSDCGSDFKNPDHNYTPDLDMFDRRGVFHYINRAMTGIGKTVLAKWLKAASPVETLRKRQEAVAELSRKVDFRQAIQARGMKGMTDSKAPENLQSMVSLFSTPIDINFTKVKLFFFYLLPTLTLAALCGIYFRPAFLWVAIGIATLQLIVNKFFSKEVDAVYIRTTKNYNALKTYAGIIFETESHEFQSDRLKRLQHKLSVKNHTASFYIDKIAALMQSFDLRSSDFLHGIVNNVLFWDMHHVYRIQKWQQACREDIEKWMDVVGEVEALCTLGNVHFNHPRWVMPGFAESGFALEVSEAGHFLIPPDERVCNDFKMTKQGDILVVTGPNMAGKSTFLRTIGINLAMALAGGPVCANHFVTSNVKLYTSMKISDSLDKKLSLFYAELKRLKMILDGILDNEPVFFIIDEMLKGTNTLDRRKGAIALIKQLIVNKANGIVATHDLELAKLSEAFPDTIGNFHFDGFVEDDKLIFDYKLKDGVCNSFNALVLMRKIGIDV